MLKPYLKKSLLVAAILVAPIYILYCIRYYGVPVPWGDQWEFVPLIEKMFNHNLKISDVWMQFNEHRIFFPKVIMLALAYLTNWNIRYELYTNFCLAGITLLFLYSMLKKIFPLHVPKWLAIAFSAIVFSTWQYENWMWGWTIQIFLCVLAVVIAIWSLDRWPGKMKGVVFSLAAAVVASYSFNNGLLTWVVVLPMLLQRKARNWRHISLWAVAFIATVCLYYYHYTKPVHLPTLWLFLNNIIAYTMYILIYLGTPFIYSPGIPILPLFAGGIVLIIEAVMVIHITLLRREDIDLMLPWLVFDGFVLLSACATSIGRLQIGLFYAMSSRYTAFSNLFFLSFLVTAQRWAIAYVETNKYYTKKMPALKAVFLLILVMAFMLSSVFGGFGMAVDSQRRNECWQALQMYPNTPYIYLQQVSVLQSNVSSTRARVETLSRLGIIIPKSVSIKAREKQNRVDQKLSQINEALRLEPQNPDLYIKLVVAYSNNQNIEQAIQAYQLALRIDPGSFQKLYKIALIDADDKRLDEAINLLQMLSEIKPNDPAVDYKIACFYSRQSKTEEATIFLKNAVMKGFNDWGNLQTDPDLENTRNTSYYKKLINNINSSSTPSSIFSINKNIEYMKSLFLRLKLIVHR